MAQKISLARDSLQAHEPAHRLSRIRRQGYQRWRLLRSYFSLAWLYEKRWFFIAMLVPLLAEQGSCNFTTLLSISI